MLMILCLIVNTPWAMVLAGGTNAPFEWAESDAACGPRCLSAVIQITAPNC